MNNNYINSFNNILCFFTLYTKLLKLYNILRNYKIRKIFNIYKIFNGFYILFQYKKK